jgi:hypothetical protein
MEHFKIGGTIHLPVDMSVFTFRNNRDDFSDGYPNTATVPEPESKLELESLAPTDFLANLTHEKL